MSKNLLSLVVSFLSSVFAFATDDEGYSVLAIPKELLKNANVVFRNHSTRIEIEGLGKMRVTERYAVTILNEAGEDYAQFVEHYDKLSSIKGIDGKLFDANGKKIRELKKNEIKDVSNISDISLFEDNRVKLHNFYYKVFPYTVEYECEVVYDGTLFIPPYFPQRGYGVSVEKSDYIVSIPSASTLVIKKVNFEKEPGVTTDKDKKIYRWETQNLAAIQRETFSPSFSRVVPNIRLALAEFEFEGYKGSNSSWKEFGKFVYELKKNRDELPDPIKQQVRNLVAGLNSNEEKIKKLYEYLQANTRYISVQLGIGGLQPFDAKYVAGNRYGDCKALSNYMFALLKEAGISSLYTIIKAGDDEEDIFTDFSTTQFNHVVLCVPNNKDTMWLECTDQYKSAGYMGDFTGNRHALLITEEGGVLVKTPQYSMNENLQLRKIQAVLSDDGTLNFKADTRYLAMQQDDLHGAINRLAKDKWKERLQGGFDFSTYNINSFDYKEQKGKIPGMNETLDITVFNYATITGKRLFIVPDIMTKTYRRLSADSTRKFDIDLGFAYKDVDSIEIQLPAGYSQESVPQDVNINSKFAAYKASVQVKDGKLFYNRQIEYKGGVYPASDYAELVKFYEAIYKADRNRVVLFKNEGALKAF
jgi:Domain of Unknown Function with PDB structure (DUF3857)/Transglutaminase-like superfamily